MIVKLRNLIFAKLGNGLVRTDHGSNLIHYTLSADTSCQEICPKRIWCFKQAAGDGVSESFEVDES